MTSNPFFASITTDPRKAMPRIQAVDLEVDDNPWQMFTVRGSRPLRMTLDSISRYLPCPNPRCRRGGIDMQRLLSGYAYGEPRVVQIDARYPCGGDEGSPAGRKKGSECMNSFKVKGTITIGPDANAPHPA